MSRHLLALLLLSAVVSAHAITPARQDANGGGGTCPEAEATTEAAEGPAAPELTPAPHKSAPPAQAKSSPLSRPKSGARWHSFLPGMFK